MSVTLTIGQLDRLATLFLNIAQALFIIALAASYFARETELIDSLKAFMLGLLFTYLSLKAEQQKTEGVKVYQ